MRDVESIASFILNSTSQPRESSRLRGSDLSQPLLAINLDLPLIFNIKKYLTWPSQFLSLDNEQQRLFVALHSTPLWVDTSMKKPKLLNPFGLPFPIEVQRLLSNNIKFIPRPHIDKMSPMVEYDRLERSVRTNYLFRKAKEKTGRDTFIPKLHVKSLDWVPPSASPIIEKGLRPGRISLLQAVRKADPTMWRPNLSICSLRSLGHLMIEHDFIVKASGKNLGLTVLPREWYINEALRQLSDTSTYAELDPANHDTVIPTLMSARHKLISKVMSSPELFRIILKSAEKFLLQLNVWDYIDSTCINTT
ncbi:BQ5605_C047g12288 [Microbotryum silenes-dioicae]|uniref:BQ5605_C047g12288 protein n=1 Tax=Microbotryum silenes-dioicae TaxID=796604 RepID=A0A2X0NHH0_9BASI|nr:BQ5605_C047g12288 [Microbotryum silenes-dioicae]